MNLEHAGNNGSGREAPTGFRWRSLRDAVSVSLFVCASLVAQTGFHWDWGRSRELGVKDSLQAAKLPESEKVAIANAILPQLRVELTGESDLQLRSIALKSAVKLTDLNGDGVPEVLVKVFSDDLCSPTGNCPFLVFKKQSMAIGSYLKTNPPRRSPSSG
jgi:hypothetical protein